MQYIGKLYGSLGKEIYFDTGKTSDDWDNMEKKIVSLLYDIDCLNYDINKKDKQIKELKSKLKSYEQKD